MPEINLDKILQRVRPAQWSLTFEGTSYGVRRLTIADVASIEALRGGEGVSPAESDRRTRELLRSLFVEASPPFLNDPPGDEPADDVANRNLATVAMTAAFMTAFTETTMLPNVVRLVREETSRQMTAADTTSSS